MTLVGKMAPAFRAEAVDKNGEFVEIDLSSYRDHRNVVLFFYPLDFTFVCPSEIIAFSNRVEEFESRNVQVLGCSVDSKYSHWAFRNRTIEEGGIGAVKYPLISDLSKNISTSYGILTDAGVSLRATYLIDREGVVRHETINDLFLGRSVDETLRVVDGLQHYEQHGEVCPAGWHKGAPGMRPDASGVADYLSHYGTKL